MALGRERGGRNSETHTIQVLNEPRQILITEVREGLYVLFPIEELGELTVKLGRGPVQVAEFL